MNLKIHKALLEEDAIIEIRGFPGEPKNEVEGKSIAQTLWSSLPAGTIDVIIAELNRLEKALKEE